MSEVQSQATGIKAQYADQVTADLERNAKEQERVSAEVTSLQEQLRALQHDQAVLLGVQQALGSDSSHPGTVEPATVPTPRKTSAASRSKKAATRKSQKTPAEKAPSKVVSAKRETAQLTLVDLVRRHLAEQSEPRSATEITSAIAQTQPERNVKTTVIRTTLEGLVAKGFVERSKQSRSVFYATATSGNEPEQEQPAESAS
jgi:hypothetical protein